VVIGVKPLQSLGNCPRCGEPIKSLNVRKQRGRLYLLAYHGYADGKPKYCYLGPLQEREKIHVDLPWLSLDCLEQYAREYEEEAKECARNHEYEYASTLLLNATMRVEDVAREAYKIAERLGAQALLYHKKAEKKRKKPEKEPGDPLNILPSE
jgi:hypothetical protein